MLVTNKLSVIYEYRYFNGTWLGSFIPGHKGKSIEVLWTMEWREGVKYHPNWRF